MISEQEYCENNSKERHKARIQKLMKDLRLKDIHISNLQEEIKKLNKLIHHMKVKNTNTQDKAAEGSVVVPSIELSGSKDPVLANALESRHVPKIRRGNQKPRVHTTKPSEQQHRIDKENLSLSVSGNPEFGCSGSGSGTHTET